MPDPLKAASAADRAAGVILGLAAGDRNGGPTWMALETGESLVSRGVYGALW